MPTRARRDKANSIDNIDAVFSITLLSCRGSQKSISSDWLLHANTTDGKAYESLCAFVR